MKKINRFLMIYMVVITVLCICMCYLAFSANEKKDNLKEVRSQITTTAEKKQTTPITAALNAGLINVFVIS